MSMIDFKNRFVYDAAKAGCVGIERECFLTEGGVVVPRAHEVLSLIESKGVPMRKGAGNFWSGTPAVVIEWARSNGNSSFGYELSACQLESRIGPCTLTELPYHLMVRDEQQSDLLGHLGLSAHHVEVGPQDMPLDVYPDPTGRYQKITANMPRSILEAACRVIGTHVHVGMRDHSMALRVYNHATNHHEELCELGNGSFGERMQLYRKMAPNCQSYRFHSWEMFHKHAVRKGFEEDPRKCWTLIRISVHGTIEFRMFGATSSLERIDAWARRCHEICTEVM